MDKQRPILIKELHGTEIMSETDGRWAETYAFLYLTEGTLEITAAERLYSLTAGDAVLFAPRSHRCLRQEKDARWLLLTFEADQALLEPFGNCAFSLPEARSAAEQLCTLIEAEAPLETMLRLSLAELLILCALQKAPMDSAPLRRDGQLYLRAIQAMQQSIALGLSLNDLADQLQISLSHLKRIFARYAKIGAHEYLIELRLNRAKALLEAGHSVTETAALTGFANQAYFSAAFKKSTGRSPKEYFAKGAVKKESKPKAKKPEGSSKRSDMPSYLL